MHDAPGENNCYTRYQELGGIINEKDYKNALARSKNTTTLDITLIKQSELIGQIAGIELCNAKGAINQIIILYGILRTDTKPKNTTHHYSQMCDERLFAEALRMLEDTDSLNKLIAAFPHISFN